MKSVSRSLQLRLLTAAIGMPILLLLIWVGNWPFAVVAGLVTFGGTTEFVRGWLFPEASFKETLRIWPILLLPAIMVAGAYFEVRFFYRHRKELNVHLLKSLVFLFDEN